jgi:hypothetical protein
MSNWTEEALEDVVKLYDNNTYEEIQQHLKKKHKIAKSPNAIRKAYYRKIRGSKPRIHKEPKVLFFDLETSPILGHVWSLWNNNVALNQMDKDWHILSWSAKWLHDPPNKIMYSDQRHAKNVEDDSKLLGEIWKLIDEADIIVGQNSKSFDIKKLNARFIMNGFAPPSSYKHIDTKEIAKKYFAFTSNRLEYMSDKLNKKYKKQKHAKFSGFELWKECLAGNLEAWKEMEKYNKYDVLSLEELYKKLIPWDKSAPNFNLYHEDEAHVCKCGSVDFVKSGFHYTQTGKFQKWKCKKCGAESRDRDNLFSKEKRKSLRMGV